MKNNLGFFKEKTSLNKYRWSMFAILCATFLAWIAWIAVDVAFVKHGIHIEFGFPSTLVITATVVWEEIWQNASEAFALIFLCFMGISFFMELIYVVIRIRGLKQNRNVAIYELILHSVIVVAIFAFGIMTVDMLRKDQWLLFIPPIENVLLLDSIKEAIAGVKLYHLDFLNYTTAIISFVIFSAIALALSDKKEITAKNVAPEFDITLIAYAVLVLALLPIIIVEMKPGADVEIGQIDWDNIFIHASGAIITQPIGAVLGAAACVMFLKLAANVLWPKEELSAKTLAPNTLFLILSLALFVALHVFQIDLLKFIRNELYGAVCLGFGGAVLLCLAPAIYASVGLAKYCKNLKSPIKPKRFIVSKK